MITKPYIYFTENTLSSNALEREYNKVATEKQLIELVFKWLEVLDTRILEIDNDNYIITHNDTFIKKVVYRIYSWVTGIKYESKINL